MTMAEVLEGIRGLGERFDRHAKRLAALERETGMDPDPDDDDDDDEAKKKAEEAMADDDDDDKDRGQVQDASDNDQGTNPQGHQGKGQASSHRQIWKHPNKPQPGAQPKQDG